MAGNPSIAWQLLARYGSAAGDSHDAHCEAPDARGSSRTPDPGGLGQGLGSAMTWAKSRYLRSNPWLVSSSGPGRLLATEVAELAGYVVGQRPRAALAGEVVHRQQAPTGRHRRTCCPLMDAAQYDAHLFDVALACKQGSEETRDGRSIQEAGRPPCH